MEVVYAHGSFSLKMVKTASHLVLVELLDAVSFNDEEYQISKVIHCLLIQELSANGNDDGSMCGSYAFW